MKVYPFRYTAYFSVCYNISTLSWSKGTSLEYAALTAAGPIRRQMWYEYATSCTTVWSLRTHVGK